MNDPVMERIRRADPVPRRSGETALEWPGEVVGLLTSRPRPARAHRRRRRRVAVGAVGLAGALAAGSLALAGLMSTQQSPADHEAGLENVMDRARASGAETWPPGGVFYSRPSQPSDLAATVGPQGEIRPAHPADLTAGREGEDRWNVWLMRDFPASAEPGAPRLEGLWVARPSFFAAARTDCPAPTAAEPVRACLREPAAPERYVAGRVAPGVADVEVVDAEGVVHRAVVANGLFLAPGLPAPAERIVALAPDGGAMAEAVLMRPPGTP